MNDRNANQDEERAKTPVIEYETGVSTQERDLEMQRLVDEAT